MPDAATTAIADAYWADHFGCPANEFFTTPVRTIGHGGELTGYWGVFALFREASVMVSVPHDADDGIYARLALPRSCESLAALALTLEPFAERIIGPAFIGYASEVPRPLHCPRALDSNDAHLLQELENSCEPIEWDHGGSSLDHPCSGVIIEGRLAALAGYEIWGNSIAHLAVVCHPDFRGRGFGKSAVAHLAARAMRSGLLPQYRTLDSNAASMGIGASLGFRRYATSLAVRLKSLAKE